MKYSQIKNWEGKFYRANGVNWEIFYISDALGEPKPYTLDGLEYDNIDVLDNDANVIEEIEIKVVKK